MLNCVISKSKLAFILALLIGGVFSVQADVTWNFSDGNTHGWTGAGINWHTESVGWTSTKKTIDGFTPSTDPIVIDGRLAGKSYYLASPTNTVNWSDYSGGKLNIKMTETASASDYHAIDGILTSGGTHSFDSSTELSGYHPTEVLPYVLMQTQIGGNDVYLAAPLIFTNGSSEHSIALDSASWVEVDIAFLFGELGSDTELTITASALSDDAFLEALANCQGIFIRSEYDVGGSVGGGSERYITQISEISLTLIPEPSICAGIFGAIALVFAVYRRRKS